MPKLHDLAWEGNLQELERVGLGFLSWDLALFISLLQFVTYAF